MVKKIRPDKKKTILQRPGDGRTDGQAGISGILLRCFQIETAKLVQRSRKEEVTSLSARKKRIPENYRLKEQKTFFGVWALADKLLGRWDLSRLPYSS